MKYFLCLESYRIGLWTLGLSLAIACDDAGGEVVPPPAPQSADFLIDDFEDGDGMTESGAVWYSYDDVANGGGSEIDYPRNEAGDVVMANEGFSSERSLLVEFSFDQGDLPYEPYVGFGVTLGSSAQPLDLSEYATLQYSYRGAAHSVRFETFDVLDFDYHGVVVPASSAWTTIELPLALFAQEGWGEAVAFNPANIAAMSFHLRGVSGETGSLHIDNLGLVAEAGERQPDMEIRDPAPPAPVQIDSPTIDNPLQATAMKSLNKGYNVTNWLEQGRFQGFDYDEAFVESLSAAGFESLRLPIDLDLYVEEVTGEGADLELTLHDDLFLILDSFNTWTEDNGLSLTIDYHQYDRSLDFADTESKALAVALWAAVAQHFADNSRQDLFFELLNEPELSVSGTSPTQAQWTELAEQMIAAIRAHSDHTIIFGDIEWYGIGPLSRRQPLSDANIIYAFHFYEPFIFTHQGASWANLGTTHDIPFPYDPERWSEYYGDLGFTPFMESWLLGEAQNYYRTGHPEALRNRIWQAKQWAVEHNVPVICNEFGVYDASSTLDDRTRYYSELVGIFEELAIPWQHWFMILGDDGSVLPEYQAAFELEAASE